MAMLLGTNVMEGGDLVMWYEDKFDSMLRYCDVTGGKCDTMLIFHDVTRDKRDGRE